MPLMSFRTKSAIVTAVVAGALLPSVSALAAPTSAPTTDAAAVAEVSYTTASGDLVEFLSDEQLAARFGNSRIDVGSPGGATDMAQAVSIAQSEARADGIAPAATPASYAPAAYDPGTTWSQNACGAVTDKAGNSWRTRFGDYSNFGYNKIVVVHGITSCDVITAPYKGGLVDKKVGTNWTYYGTSVINGYPVTPLTTVASRSTSSMYGQTPDRAYVGTITAYCNNASTQMCPDYIP